MSEKLLQHREVWNNKRILRESYAEWYRKILMDLKGDGGITVEVGSGTGNFREFKPDVITSDIEKCDWIDMCFDAHSMPFNDGSVSNIVMIDVLHHLSNPIKFLAEASRVLEKGGRLVIVEPFPSPVSSIVYRLFHPEPFIMDIDYFKKKDVPEKDPWESNQAVAYLLFYRQIERFERLFAGCLKVLKTRRMSFVLYPLSGGFEHKALVPDFLIPFLKALEAVLSPLARLLAFRCYVVIERI
jgi:SAM-dependent methyltransferase